MKKRTFSQCLNKQRKFWNFSIGGVVGCASCALIFGLPKGVIWGLAAGAIGFVVGNWISRSLYLGYLQRGMYWYLPYAKIWLSPSIPESSEREEL